MAMLIDASSIGAKSFSMPLNQTAKNKELIM